MLLGYVRVSSQEQAAEDKTSLEQQERIIRGYAMAKGFTQFETSIYSDPGISAAVPLGSRPAGKRLIDDANKGDTIIASKLDRMFRSASDALHMVELFRKHGIGLVLFDLGSEPVADSALGQFFFTIVAAVATLERTMIKERCSSGKKAKIAKGGHAGGSAPYGYRVVGSGRDARREEIPEEQAVLARIREMSSVTVIDACRRLDMAALRSRTGRPFEPMQVWRMMKQVRTGAEA